MYEHALGGTKRKWDHIGEANLPESTVANQLRKLVKAILERTMVYASIAVDSKYNHCVLGGTGRKRIHCIENLITLRLECHTKRMVIFLCLN